MGVGCTKAVQTSSDLVVNAETTPVISTEIGGTVKIICDKKIDCKWFKDGNAALLELSADRMTAFNVPIGAYEVQCQVSDESLTVNVNMTQISIPRIDKYTVTHSTNDLSRNGKVEVHVADLTESVKYLWTTGIVTDEPFLEDILPGIYSATLMSSSNKVPILFYHACNVAIVESKKNEFNSEPISIA